MYKLILFLFTCISVYAQWEIVNPLPQGNRIDKIIFADSLHGWVDCRNNLLTTNEGGMKWDLHTFDYFIGRSKLFALNSKDLWLFHSDEIKNKNRLYISNNSGEAWEEILLHDDLENTLYITDIFFWDNLVGYCSTYRSFIYKTVDGGHTWLKQQAPFPPIWQLNSISFINKDKGFAVGSTPLLYTIDGGETWSIDSTMLGGDFGLEGSEILFLDSLNGYILSSNSVYRSNNGGTDWTEYIVEKNPNKVGKGDYVQNNISFLNKEIGWIASSWGVYETLDSGKTWNYVDSSSSFQDVIYLNENEGFAAISDGILYDINNELVKTVDGGLTWEKITSKFTDSILRSIDLIDDKNGWIVGSKSKILSTIDGGATWIEHETVLDSLNLTDFYLNNVKFINQQVGWVSSLDGLLINTIDCGKNWEIKLNNDKYDIYEIFLADELNIWIGGGEQTDNGYSSLLLHSIDGGISWEKIDLNWSSSILGIYFNGNEGCLSTGHSNGAVFYTNDSGNNWQNIYTDLNLALGKMQFVSPKVGWISTDNHFIKTIDGGKTWQPQIRNIDRPMVNFYFVDENNGWALGILGEITRTSDGGDNWEIQRSSVSGFTLWDIDFTNSHKGFCVGDFGMIIKTENGGLTNIKDVYNSYHFQNKFSLYQNYPNPFNPTTIITYSIPKQANISIKIYDDIGREISTLVNESLLPGKYQIVFDGSSLPSGIYFYRLQAEEFSETKKLLLLK